MTMRVTLRLKYRGNTIVPSPKALEVPMKKIKHESKAAMIARFQAEARKLAGEMSENQKHFLKVIATSNRALEPLGRLAG